jgi:hypothetical protein
VSKITAYSALATLRSDDVLPVVDVHDTSMASTGTTKNVTVANLLNGVQVTWNVRAYGGATGDGVTDDTTALQNTCNAAGAGGTVYVPAGTYVCAGLTLSFNFQTWNIDPGATLLLKAASNATLLTISGNDVTVQGYGFLDGNKANNTSGSQLVLITNTNATLSGGLVIQNCWGYGVNADGNVTNLDIHGCYFTNTVDEAIAVHESSNTQDVFNISIAVNTIDNYNFTPPSGHGAGGITVWGPLPGGTPHYIRGVVITGNVIGVPNAIPTLDACIVTNRCYGAAVSGNTCYGGFAGLTAPSCFDLTVNGNTFYAWGAAGYALEIAAGDAGGGDYGTSGDVTITGNTMLDTDPTGGGGTHTGTTLALNPNASTITNVSITGNTIVCVPSGATQFYAIQSLPTTVNGLSHCVIAGNTITRTNGVGGAVMFQDCSQLSIIGNIFDGSGVNRNMINVLTSAAQVTDITIQGNIIRNYGNATGLIYGGNSFNVDYATVTGNVFNSPAGTNIGPAGTKTWGPNCSIQQFSPPPSPLAPATGSIAETLSRVQISSNAVAIAATGVVWIAAVWLPANQLITNINWLTGATAGGTMTHWWLGLANSSRVQLASCTDQTSGAIAANTLITKALTAAFTTTYAGLHYLLLSVSATTMPTSSGIAAMVNATKLTPIASGTSGTTQAAPGTNGTTTYGAPASDTAGVPYMFAS